MDTVTYYLRGDIERWSATHRCYVWVPGYSAVGENGGGLYPWGTRAECCAEAASEGKRPVFVNVITPTRPISSGRGR